MWTFIKRIPLTAYYILMHLIYTAMSSDMGEALHEPSIMVPLPKEGAVYLSITMIFVAFAAILLGFELRKSSRFQPRDNNADAFLSIGICGAYWVMFLFYNFFQTELFLLFVVLTTIDAMIGLLTILGVSRRSFDVDDRAN